MIRINRPVAELRKRLGLTQPAIAYLMGVTVRTIARWEDNGPSGSAIYTLLGIARHHGLYDLAEEFLELAKDAGNANRNVVSPSQWTEGREPFND